MTTITDQLAEALRRARKDLAAACAVLRKPGTMREYVRCDNGIKAADEALAAYDAQRGSVENDPAAILVHAYAKAGDSGSVEWEDVNSAYEAARAQLGEVRCAEIEALYPDED